MEKNNKIFQILEDLIVVKKGIRHTYWNNGSRWWSSVAAKTTGEKLRERRLMDGSGRQLLAHCELLTSKGEMTWHYTSSDGGTQSHVWWKIKPESDEDSISKSTWNARDTGTLKLLKEL